MIRSQIEEFSRRNAGVLEEYNDWKLVRVLGDFDMYVSSNDQSITPHLIADGFWESWITTWMFLNIRPGVVFWDVGANTGYYSFLAYVHGAMVSAFEPNPDYFDMMTATVVRNKWTKSMIRISPKALSDVNGHATLYVPANLHGSASFTPMDKKWGYHEIEVETTRFDHYVRGWGAGKQIMKIDAEGAEEKIFNGMGNRLVEVGKPIILMEYTPNAYSDKFLSALEDYAQLAWINYDGMEQLVTREWIESQTDWVMLVLRPR